MLAYRLLQAQTQPEFQEVPEPHAGPGQIVVRVAGSGLCRRDFAVISREPSDWKDQPPPFTLGHEISGWVEELGTGVTKFQRGDAVAVNPCWPVAWPPRSTLHIQAAGVACGAPRFAEKKP